MTALLCILTLGFECGWVDDNHHHESPATISAPVPEPTAALLFGAGIGIAAITTRCRR